MFRYIKPESEIERERTHLEEIFRAVLFPFSQSEANGLRIESDGLSPTELPLDTEAVVKSASAPLLSGTFEAPPWGFGSGKLALEPGLCEPESMRVTAVRRAGRGRGTAGDLAAKL